jgi:uncharacterized protein YbjT (DUF2867 family)
MSGAEIFVSGATGRTGGAAIAELLKMGRSVRAYVRSDGEQASALRKQGVEIAIGDFTDIDAIRAAMKVFDRPISYIRSRRASLGRPLISPRPRRKRA